MKICGKCKVDRDLGCSLGEFKLYIENQFEPGMTWDNYGTKWHLDHFIPLSYFDLNDRTQFLEAFHYTNVQPLWAKDNLKKSNKLPFSLEKEIELGFK